MADRELLTKKLAKARQVLEVLEVQYAGFGDLHAPAHLVIELQNQQQKVLALAAELAKLESPPSQPSTAPPTVLVELEGNLTEVSNALLEGELVFFLGNEINLTQSTDGANPHALDDKELAHELAHKFNFQPDIARELLKVAQRGAVLKGINSVYRELRQLLAADYQPLSIHRTLAAFPSILKAKDSPNPCQLIVTNDFDDLLEKAFEAADEPFDLVAYIAEGDDQGRFLHWPPGKQQGILIKNPNEYNQEFSLEKRTIILKIHGAVHGANPLLNRYAITEDHYIDYMKRDSISNLVPANLLEKLQFSHLLFLGYSLEDWNQRLILNRLLGGPGISCSSWSVQENPSPLDVKLWADKNNAKPITANLDVYLTGLTKQVRYLLELLEEPQ